MRCKTLLAAATAAALLVSPVPSFADEPEPVITPIRKGTPAPYTGLLLTPEAVARIVSEAKDCPKRIDVEVEKARAEEKARADKTVSDVQADAKRDRSVCDANIARRDGDIKDLTTRLEKSENARKSNWLWVGGGVVAGALLTVVTVLAVGATN